MKSFQLFISVAVIVFGSLGVAQKSKTVTPKVDMKSLSDATVKYRKAKMVKSDLLKLVKSELTGKETKNEGKISISEGLFRIENKSPEKSLLIFDGRVLWNEQKPSDDFGGPTQVTKAVISKKQNSQTLFATLLTKDPITKHFKILSSKADGDLISYDAQSTNPEINFKDLKIIIQSKKLVVQEISFKDDIGNLTTMKFSNTQFKDSVDKKLFTYNPPKGAQVTTL